MISLAEFSPPLRFAIRLLWAAGIGATAVFAVVAIPGGLDAGRAEFQALYVCLFLAPAGLCLLRAVLVAQERVVWALIGFGMAAQTGGWTYYYLVLQSQEQPPYPSLSDAMWLSLYACSIVALLLLMRARLTNFRRGFWIDAVVGALALAAVSAVLLIEPIIASTGGGLASVATNLAYPVADLLIIAVVLGVLALTGWRPGRDWVIIGSAFVLFAVADSVYLYQVSHGIYQSGTLLDAIWPAALLMVAAAAWHVPRPTQGKEVQGWPALMIASGFAVVALFITTYDSFVEVGAAAVTLSTLTLIAAFVRTAMTFGDMRKITHTRDLLLEKESILRAAGEGIYGLGPDGHVTFANPEALRLTGHAADEIEGRHLHGSVHHHKSDGSPYALDECPIAASLRDGTLHDSDTDVFWRRDGSSFPVEYTSTPIIDGGRVSGAVVVFKDITERRLVERAKDEFTSIVSHELRTPLTSIRGSLGLLESGVLGALAPKGQRMVQIAVQNTDRLVRLVNDILDIERIDSGQIDMHQQSCDAAQLVGRAVEEIGQLVGEAGVRLVVDAERVALFADPDRVLQTLTNLISNAAKFSSAGSTVRVSCVRVGDEALFEVADQGRGIPVDKLESIFERFQQVDASDSREKGGTGLGLAICRTIVEHHGGRIWVDSKLGAGSTFSFVLPASQAGGLPAGGAVDGAPAILVCDDDVSVVEVVGAMLEQRGYRVIAAHCGEQALELARSECPDVILLDLLMAGMSGWETAAALKRHPDTCDIPVVILSVLSEAEAEADARAPDAAVSDWLEKPLDEAALFAALQRAVGARDELFRVLIVEDDVDLAEILTTIFRRHGMHTFCAADGRDAIRQSQRMMPDLLVLDIGLPEADGFEVVDWLRRHERLSALPMVVYTARELDEHDRERLRLGSDTEFLTKGRITPADFEDRVVRLLGRLAHPPTPKSDHEPQAHPVGR